MPQDDNALMVTAHFSRQECVRSRTARREGVPNMPDAEQWERITAVSVFVLELVRQHYHSPVVVTSFYRAPALNRLVSKERLSAHQYLPGRGKRAHWEAAVDFQVPGVPLVKVFNWLVFESGIPYDIIILERGKLTDSEGDDCIHYQISSRPRSLAMLGETRGTGRYTLVERPLPE